MAGQSQLRNGARIGGRDFVEFILVGFATFLATYSSSFLIGAVLGNRPRPPILSDDGIVILLIRCAVFLIALMAFNFLVRKSRDIRSVRLLFDPRAQFEGVFFELFFDDRSPAEIGPSAGATSPPPKYAVFEVWYTGSQEDAYWISGTLYDPDGKYYSVWRTGSIVFEENDKRIEYIYTTDMSEKPGRIKGLASLTFRRHVSGLHQDSRRGKRRVNRKRSQLLSGSGYIIEEEVSRGSVAVAKRSHFEFIRITRQEIKHLVPDLRQRHGSSQIQQFVAAYHSRFHADFPDRLVDPML